MAGSSKNKRNIKVIIKYLLILIFIGTFLGIGAGVGLVAALVKDEPIRSEKEIRDAVSKNNLTGFAYFANTDQEGNNVQIGVLRPSEDRRLIKYDEIPKNVINAVLAVEDREFFEHSGVNLKALSRAVIQQVLKSDVQTGGSTITQQLSKITFFSFEKSYTRKAREIFLALRMERILSKEDIITAYLNKIPFGKASNLNNVYGIQAAAKGYFNKDIKDLNIAEAAYLAGIPQRPTAYSAFNSNGFDEEGYDLAKKRQQLVLKRMLEEEFITNGEYEEAMAYDIKAAFASFQGKAYTKYPFLMMEIESRAAEKLLEVQGVDPTSPEYSEAFENTKQELLNGGYKVYTTIDKDIYEMMNDIAKNPDNFYKPISYDFKLGDGSVKRVENALQEVGATLINNKSGAILGFIGGRDYTTSAVNHSNFRATSKRQPGSSIKPMIAYGPALELGLIQPSSPIDDIPLGGDWEPANWNKVYNGRITARNALWRSYNIPAVKVYSMVGKEKGYQYLTDMGLPINKKWFMEAGLTPAIGTIESSPEEMTRAFATFANGGTYVGSYMIEKIVDKDGNVIFENQPNPKVVFSEQTAFLMTDMLRDVVNHVEAYDQNTGRGGAGTGVGIRKYVGSKLDFAGKTGTTNDSKDLWFVGYTPEVSLGVWVGYDYPYELRPGSIASDIWGKIMSGVLKTNSEISPIGSKFNIPPGVVKMEVSTVSGKLPSELTTEAGYTVTDWFNKKYIPTEVEDALEKAKVIEFNGKTYLAKEETPQDMTTEGIFYKREPYTVPEGKEKPKDYKFELPNEADPRTSNGTAPATPGNASFKAEGNKNIISWDKNTNESIVGYRVYRGSSSDLGFAPIIAIKQTDNKAGRVAFEDTTGNSSSIYYVVAVDVAGLESSPTDLLGNSAIIEVPNDEDPGDNEASGLPRKPRNVQATISSSGLQITLQWNASDSEENVTKYNVYYSEEESGNFRFIGYTENNSFIHPSVLTEDAYYYVTAVNSNGESLPSKVVKAQKE